jgi:hypothetical protein
MWDVIRNKDDAELSAKARNEHLPEGQNRYQTIEIDGGYIVFQVETDLSYAQAKAVREGQENHQYRHVIAVPGGYLVLSNSDMTYLFDPKKVDLCFTYNPSGKKTG